MAKFEEVAYMSDYPVIHTHRKDGATLLATRVPLDDIRLELWGWILSLSYKDGHRDQDDIETLQDQSGRKYPKVYQLTDIQNYIEEWRCTDWAVGYQPGKNIVNAELTAGNNKATGDVDLTNILEEKLTEVVAKQETQTGLIRDGISDLRTGNRELFEGLQEHTIDAYNRLLNRIIESQQDIKKQIDILDSEIETQVKQSQENLSDITATIVKGQSQLTRENAERLLENINNQIIQQLLLVQTQIKEDIADPLQKAIHDYESILDIIKEEIKTGIENYNAHIQPLLDDHSNQLRLIKEISDKILESVSDTTEDSADENTSDTAAKSMARKVTNQIERITSGQHKLITDYFNNTKDEARSAFKLVRILSITGAATFVGIIVLAIIMAFLHLYDYTVLLGSIAGIGGAIATTMGRLSGGAQVKVSKQFADSLLLLDRSYRPVVAQTMCVGYVDDDRRQQALDRIIDRLLASDAVSKNTDRNSN